MSNALARSDVERARAELDRMKRSLRSWMKYRMLNDAVLQGRAPSKKPLPFARAVISSSRDMASEQRLAKQLSVLLAESFPEIQLPIADVSANPNAALELARIALSPSTAAVAAAQPEAQGMLWFAAWPLLIVGGLLLAITTAIKTSADLAAERERYACIQAGACTDYGFWLKAGGIAAIGYVAWQMGAVDKIKALLKK